MKRANVDKHGRLVKKGLTVHVPGKYVPGTVVKVSRGQCLVKLLGFAQPFAEWCDALEVVR